MCSSDCDLAAMRVIIAGSRGITDYTALQYAIAQTDFSISIVVCGAARGVDTLGAKWASEKSLPCMMYRADWGRFRRAAGQYRNWEMAKHADGLLALWDGESRGTLHMIDCMRRLGKTYEVYIAPNWEKLPHGPRVG